MWYWLLLDRWQRRDLADDVVVVNVEKPEGAPIDGKSLFPEMPFNARPFEVPGALKQVKKKGRLT